MRARTVLAGIGISLAAVTIAATPALAADATLKVDNPETKTSPDARVTWDDKTDTLCVKSYTGKATAAIKRSNGKWYRVRDSAGDRGGNCTGNLVIREDFRTTIGVVHHAKGTTSLNSRKTYT
ncbi:MAG: hypothetical protein GEV10_29310 [Streptosporangiales bacterium]|nr:hypothetical protein [Streptosporangiales bacterium]